MDAGIAYGMGRWPGVRSTLLGRARSSRCAARLPAWPAAADDVEQLRHETLLSIDDDRPGLMGWPLWFGELGIKGYSSRRHLKINSHPLLMQAACEGQGIALGWALLCDDLLRRGELVRPLGATVRTARAFHS
jgi:LysR family transcriptional regulator, glycine cleavage system transcriptional activator